MACMEVSSRTRVIDYKKLNSIEKFKVSAPAAHARLSFYIPHFHPKIKCDVGWVDIIPIKQYYSYRSRSVINTLALHNCLVMLTRESVNITFISLFNLISQPPVNC